MTLSSWATPALVEETPDSTVLTYLNNLSITAWASYQIRYKAKNVYVLTLFRPNLLLRQPYLLKQINLMSNLSPTRGIFKSIEQHHRTIMD